MSKNILEAALTASAEELKNEKSAKAKRILMGVDVHLRGYQSARKVDNGVIGAVETCRSEVELLLHIQRQRQRAEEVVVLYRTVRVHALSQAHGWRGALLRLCA
jgi:hypothetical protein